MKHVELLYGTTGVTLELPDGSVVLQGAAPPAIADADHAVRQALAAPLGTAPLAELVRARRPRTVAITISDITRPVPNAVILPPMLRALEQAGVPRDRVVLIIGTGMHRPSTVAERRLLLGPDFPAEVEVVDHTADRPQTLARVCDDPPVSVNRRFAEADLRIVTGLIEPHFMAGFSGGRKGVCPALVDLATIQRFHSFETLDHPRAQNGVLQGNPCHEIGLRVARAVGVDLLFNVAVTRDRRLAAVYCGELEAAHLRGCEQVAGWTTAVVERPFDLVVTCGGGFPLDQTFYQTVKGMVTALPALSARSTLLQLSACAEGLGSEVYRDLLLRWGHDWQGFIDQLRRRSETRLDQWELQMQCKTLARIGQQRLLFASDGIEDATLRRLALNPLAGPGGARERAQRAVDSYLARRPDAAVAVIPDGPYTMLTSAESP